MTESRDYLRIDLKALAESFAVDYSREFADDHALDLAVLASINAQHLPRSQRVAVVARWLVKYGVHRIKGVTSGDLAKVLIQYFDDDRLNIPKLSTRAILSEFNKLRDAFLREIPALSTGGKSRRIESLTSKALWCCYPTEIPILDSYAENALRILTRLLGTGVLSAGSRYEVFLDAWQKLYVEIEPFVSLSSLEAYPYKVRVFDHMLWWAGQPSFPNHPLQFSSEPS